MPVFDRMVVRVFFWWGLGGRGEGTPEQGFLKTTLAFFCGQHSTDIPYSFNYRPRFVYCGPYRGLFPVSHVLFNPKQKEVSDRG